MLGTLVTTRSTRRVVSRLDVTSQVEFGLVSCILSDVVLKN